MVAGDYRKVKVDEAGWLTLTTGIYRLEQLEVSRDGNLDLDTSAGPIIIEIEKNLQTKERVQMLLGDGSPRDVLFLVNGDVQLDKEGQYIGTYLAPEGNVELSDSAVLEGAIYGRQVQLKKRAAVHASPAIELTIRVLNESA